MTELNILSLSKQFGKNTVFSGLNFKTESPVTGIAGENGAGKSTLLKCISGLVKPSSGAVEWRRNGTLLDRRTLRSSIGYVAPYIQLYEELTVRENLTFIADLQNLKFNIGTLSVLDDLDARHFTDSPFGELSTGQQQRVKLAAALVHRPSILILDEPGSNLDRAGKKAVQKIVNRYRENRQMVLLASNQQQELDWCDTILDLNSPDHGPAV